jgi:hypothetical protein
MEGRESSNPSLRQRVLDAEKFRLLTVYEIAREFEFTPLRQPYMDPARVQGLK